MPENESPPSRLTRIATRLRERYEQSVLGPAAARSGPLSRMLRFGPFSSRLANSRHVHVARPSALGDVLMATPALRELKRRFPKNSVTFYTKFPTLLTGCPFIDQVANFDERPEETIELRYERSIPPRRHIAKIFGDYLGVDVKDVTPWCHVDDQLRASYREEWGALQKPILVVSRNAGPWTPNKDWPDDEWSKLIERWAPRATIVEIGMTAIERSFEHKNYRDLRGKTSLDQMIAILASCDLHVGPISGPVHIAAAFQVPAVVIYGGYEQPVCSSYEGNINLYSAVECSPCWLREPCPFAKKCLTQISVDHVSAAIEAVLSRRFSGQILRHV